MGCQRFGNGLLPYCGGVVKRERQPEIMLKSGSIAYAESASSYLYDSVFAGCFGVTQFSTASPSTRQNSRALLVTSTQPSARAWAGFRRPRALEGAYRRGLFA